MKLKQHTYPRSLAALAGILILPLCFSGISHGAVTVVGTDSGGDGSTSATSTAVNTTYNLSSGGNVLVVGAYADAGTADSVSFSFDSNAATDSFKNGRGAMAYYATDALDTTVDISVGSSAAFLGVVVWELSGVDLSKGVVSGSGDSITTTVDNTFVVGTGFVNGNVADPSATGSVYTSTDIAPFLIVGNPSSGKIGGASGLAASAGSQDISWSGDGDGSALAYGFEAVPEPSAALLVALGGLALFRRRRG